jgi:hypothetical protein
MLSAGEAGDAPEGRKLLKWIGHTKEPVALLMDRAYEGDETRALAISLGYNLLSRQRKTANIHESTTRNFTRNAPKWSGFFADTSGFAGFVPDTTS